VTLVCRRRKRPTRDRIKEAISKTGLRFPQDTAETEIGATRGIDHEFNRYLSWALHLKSASWGGRRPREARRLEGRPVDLRSIARLGSVACHARGGSCIEAGS
jgi:hypothetical protein